MNSKLVSQSRPALFGAFLLGLVLVTGCSTVSKVTTTQLQSPDELAVDPADKAARIYRNAQPLQAFGAVRLEPVRYTGEAEDLNATEQTELVNRLTESLRKALGDVAGFSDAGDLLVRATIVKADKANPTANVFSTLILGAPVNLGGVIVELEAVSVRTGERVAAARYVEAGRPWHLKSSFSPLTQAELGLDRSASRFTALLTGTAVANP